VRDSIVTLKNDKCPKHILDHYRLITTRKTNSRILTKLMKTPEGIPNYWSLSL